MVSKHDSTEHDPVERAPAEDTERACCPACGYTLVGLSESRCPECGRAFDREYLNAHSRLHLLSWERLEFGGRAYRLIRTLLQVSFRPSRFFGALARRQDKTIDNAAALVAACSIAAVCLHIGAFLWTYLVFFMQATWRHGAPRRALHITGRLISSSWTQWVMPTLQLVTMFSTLLLMAILLKRVFRRRCGALRDLDLLAVLSPVIALGAFLDMVIQCALVRSHDMMLLAIQ